jgi:dimethylamine monooxygenase subunit A
MVAVRYRPYEAGPFRWRLGLRPLDLEDWLEAGTDADHQMATKRRVLADHHDTAFAVLDGVEAEGTEVLDEVVSHLRARAATGTTEGAPDVAVPDRSLHPLDAAGRLVQEDLLIMVKRHGQLVFGGGSVCFPNRWDLASKLGLTMAQVHAPVAGLNEQLADPIDRFFDRLVPDRSFWRLGWGLLDTDELYQAMDGTARLGPGAESVDHLHLSQVYLRVERETLRRLPVTGAVLFTIRTHVAPLDSITDEISELLRLADAVEAMPPEVLEYKQLSRLGAHVVARIRELSGST